MPQTNFRWYRIFCRGLLSYLFFLNLIGFSWHLHNHYEADLAIVIEEASYFTSENTCVVCDWLVHNSYHTLDQSSTEGITHAEIVSTYFFSQTVNCHWFYPYRSPRGPPSLA